MSNPTLSNSYASVNPDIPVRATTITSGPNTGKDLQHCRWDIGVGGAESQVSSSNPLPVSVYSGLVPESYDEIGLSYTGSNLTTVTYKKASATIATLTLTYSGSQLTNVLRS